MKYTGFAIVLLFVFITAACGSKEKKQVEQLVVVSTEFGDIKLRLYDETPEHKNSFLKLVEEDFYRDLLFHRVINNFMIQGGDPDSRQAEAGVRLGGGSPGYTIPAEFVPEYFHKKGALAAARKGGPSNPEKRSSGSQFYIVQGKVFSPGELDTMVMMRNNKLKNELMTRKYREATKELNEFRANLDQEGFNLRVAELQEEVDSIFQTMPKFEFSEEQKKTYSTIWGYPSLDGEYTVFGEVVEGLEILDKITAVEVDEYNRPLKDVKMKVELVK